MIEIQNVTKKFGLQTALNEISFSIEKGSIFGLVGSNGAGKSTLLRTLCGIYRPDSGRIRIEGDDPFENCALKSRIFFIPDFPYFLPQSNLSQAALFYKSVYPNWNNETFENLCETFPIDRQQKIQAMSKGMQRQIALILALSTTPDYLLLDEIFDGLDPVMRQLLKRLLSAAVYERAMTVVIASHNLRELEDLCDHVGLLHRGGVIFEQDLDSLKLGLHKVQAVFRPMPALSHLYAAFDIVKIEVRGSLVSIVVKGTQDGILKKLEMMNPIFSEILPLTLEEVFISEMEAAGYDLENILH